MVVDNMRLPYEKLESNLKEFENNVFQLTKKLDDGNSTQKVAAEALDRANGENKLQKENSSSCQSEVVKIKEGAVANQAEIAKLNAELEISEKRKKEVEAQRGESNENTVGFEGAHRPPVRGPDFSLEFVCHNKENLD
ncbi:Uncharacterized protein Fot_14384 [Forsythia ovata]|uniref:Uncharacterized protein n=1 Tax=Forsythia ovata TaxID=205694 RepID=A0ABD1W6L7_9LAMI